MTRSLHRPGAHLALMTLLSFTLSCGGGDGGSTTPTPNPTPTITALVRDTATAGTTSFSLIISGSDFMPGVIGTFDGLPRSTSRFSQGSIGVVLQNADLVTVGDHEVRAKNPEPGGGPTAPVLFHILAPPPVPAIDSLAPDTVQAGGAAFLLNVYGTGFTPRSIIRWNGGDLTTSRPSATQLTAVVQSSMTAGAGSATVTVYTPPIGGGVSTGRTFTVLPVPSPPTITQTVPDSVVIGPGSIPFTFYGSSMDGADSVEYYYQGTQGFYLPTAVTDTSVTILLDRTGLASIGALTFRVHSPKGWSLGKLVETYNPIPVIQSVSPDTLDGSAVADTFVVTGTGFVAGMVARVGGLDVQSSTVLSYDSMRVVVTEGTLFLGGTRDLRIYDTWEGRTSAPHALAIVSPAPVVDSLLTSVPDSVGGTMLHTLVGHDLRANGEVLVNGKPRTPTWVNATEAVFFVDSGDTQGAGTLQVAFRTPGPGGGTSTSVPLQIFTPNPIPTLLSVDRKFFPVDSGPLPITVHGHGFLPGAQVELNGPAEEDIDLAPLPTTFVNDSTLTTSIPDGPSNGSFITLRVRSPRPTARASDLIRVTRGSSGLYALREVTGGASDMVGDPVRPRIYVLRQGGFSFNVYAIDVSTGVAVDSSAPLNGYTMAIAPDGSELYISQHSGGILVLDPADLTLKRVVALGSAPDSTPLVSFGIASGRHRPGRLAVATGPTVGTSTGVQVGLMDGDSLLPRKVDLPLSGGFLSMAFVEGDSTLVVIGPDPDGHFRRLAVTDSGLSLSLDTLTGVNAGERMEALAAGFLVTGWPTNPYGLIGESIDSKTGAHLYDLSPGQVGPGTSDSVAYEVLLETSVGLYHLARFDETHQVPTGYIGFSSILLGGTRRFARWGADGFAIAGGGAIVIGRSSLTTQ